MSEAKPAKDHLAAARRRWVSALAHEAHNAPGRLMFWTVALVVGVMAGYASIGFRLSIDVLQTQFYGAADATIHSHAARLNPWLIFIIPVLGGLAVGLIIQHFTPRARVLTVADVIAAAAIRDSRVGKRAGLASAAASLITLSTGGSGGREGPVVHIAAVIAAWVSNRLDHHGIAARDILGCAVASAVSASFNAPLAGTLFALEVVLRHYALHAFGPIVMASVAGAVIARIHVSEVTEYSLPINSLGFYEEMPAFLLLGVICAIVAVVMMRTLFAAEDAADRWQKKFNTPIWLRPTLAGALLGAIAIPFPHIIGVGYETTSHALTGQFALWTAISFAVVKGVAVTITYAGRMGGGIFSPSLMLGALTGLAFGEIATEVFPSLPGTDGLYALAGMGAVAAAVLGAPISTTLIVFELTGDYQAAIAVMISVSISSVLSHRFVWKSFFLSQLKRDGVALGAGAVRFLPGTIAVKDLIRIRGADDGASDTACWALAEQGAKLARSSTLADALTIFDAQRLEFLPIIDPPGPGEPGTGELIGALFHIDALKALNRALVERDQERGG
ncbi:MAG: chloride channel protein [Paracoccaceae bacterium]